MTIDPNTGAIGFRFSAGGAPQDIDSTLERLLELPAELGAEQQKQVVLVIDEFQEVGKIDPGLTRLMRSVFQQQSDVAHIYLGSKRHLMAAIFSDEDEPFWRSAKQVELGPIPGDKFAPFIRQRFRDTGKAIEAGILDRVLETTRGHPYATQRLCYEIWQATANEGTAREPEYEAAFAAVLESEDNHFALIWEGAATAQQLLLEALAEEPGRPFRRDYQERHRLRGSSTVQRALEALVQRELVAGDDSVYRISEPFLAEWIRGKVLGLARGGDFE